MAIKRGLLYFNISFLDMCDTSASPFRLPVDHPGFKILFLFIPFLVYHRALEDKQSTIAVGETAHTSDDITLDDHDIVPHFQRVSISGEDTSGVPLEDLEHASGLLIKALALRERYMTVSFQSFPQTTERFLKSVHNKTMSDSVEYEDKRTTAGK